MKNSETAFISEIFSSVQGEGIFVGQKQTFIRFVGCNIKCNYCDTPGSGISPDLKKSITSCQVKNAFGESVHADITNPLSVDNVVEICKLLGNEVVSFTGGEPLLYVDFLIPLIGALKKEDIFVYLETNGTLPSDLNLIVEDCNVVAMDIKLPSSIKDMENISMTEYWDDVKCFLEIARDSETFVKIVVSDESQLKEFIKAVKIIEKSDFFIPLVIQPDSTSNITSAALLKFQDAALEYLRNVRIIPQCHKVLGLI